MVGTGGGSRILWYGFRGILTAWLFKRFYRKVAGDDIRVLGLMTTLLMNTKILVSEKLRLECSSPRRRMKATEASTSVVSLSGTASGQ
jgi:hypothetical protein